MPGGSLLLEDEERLPTMLTASMGECQCPGNRLWVACPAVPGTLSVIDELVSMPGCHHCCVRYAGVLHACLPNQEDVTDWPPWKTSWVAHALHRGRRSWGGRGGWGWLNRPHHSSRG